MRARGAGKRLGGLCLAVALLFGQGAVGQAVAPVAGGDLSASAILTLDQDRLFSGSLYGQRVLSELEQISAELAERNRSVSAELTEEELALTEQRKTAAPKEFRLLADAFDEKVTTLREEQDARIRALQSRRDLERRTFIGRALPILSALVREAGAVAILDERAVILSADHIDITDRAIQRIDMILGDGGDLGPVEGSPENDGSPQAVTDPTLPGTADDASQTAPSVEGAPLQPE